MVIRALWQHLQGRSVTLVSDIVEVMRHTRPDPAPKRRQVRTWVPSKRRKTAVTPTTVSQDQEIRVAAAKAVVELSWTWASTGFGLGHDVPEFMAARRRQAQANALGAAFEEKLLRDVVRVWHQLGTWFQEQGVSMPSTGWPSVFIEDFLHHVAGKSGGATALLTFFKLKWMHKQARAPLCFEDVQPPVASANKGIVRQRPALEPVMVWKL